MNHGGVIVPVAAGMLGAIIGSFLNVVIYRLPREELRVAFPRRSFCPACRRQLAWFENVPVLSFLLLGGRCRTCRAPIPARYVLVEALCAFLFGAYAARTAAAAPLADVETVVALAAGLYLIAVCLAVTCIDLDWKIIPDEITWSGMGLGLLASLAAPLLHAGRWPDSWLESGLGPRLAAGAASLAGAGTGALTVLLVGWVGTLVFRKESMGLGDVKYMGLVGAFLGFDGVLLVFLLGCLTGAVGGLIHKAVTGDRYIAFGPYLSLGALLVLFFREGILWFFLEEWPALLRRMAGLG